MPVPVVLAELDRSLAEVQAEIQEAKTKLAQAKNDLIIAVSSLKDTTEFLVSASEEMEELLQSSVIDLNRYQDLRSSVETLLDIGESYKIEIAKRRSQLGLLSKEILVLLQFQEDLFKERSEWNQILEFPSRPTWPQTKIT